LNAHRLLYPQKQTSVNLIGMSVKCHEQTFCGAVSDAGIRSPRRRVRHCRLGPSILRLKVSAFGERERCRHVIAHELVKLLHRERLLFDAKFRQFFLNCG
jgi:hypothetical protein